MIVLTRKWLLFLVLSISSPSWAEGALSLDMGLGQTFFHVPSDDGDRDNFDDDSSGTWPARSFRAGISLSLSKFVNIGASAWVWGDSDLLDDEEEEENETASGRGEDRRSNPELWGSGADVFGRLGLPLGKSGNGPYVEYGRLCWSARITNLREEWSRSGCTARRGIGFAFYPSPKRQYGAQPNEDALVFRVAFQRTNLDEVNLYQFMIDGQFRF